MIWALSEWKGEESDPVILPVGPAASTLEGAKIIPFRIGEIARLREKLAEQFPAAQPKAPHFLTTGWPALDAAEGGLRRGAVTELCGGQAGGGIFLNTLLHAVQRTGCFAALVDAADSFAPDEIPPELLARLLIVRAAQPAVAAKAVDLLLRDGNLALLIFNLQGADPRARRQVNATTWHRFQRLAENSGSALVVLAPTPMVEAAQVRITLPGTWTLAAQRRRRVELVADLVPQIFLRRAVRTHFTLPQQEALG